MERFFLPFLLFAPAAALAQYLHAPSIVLFCLSALAIIPLAKYIGDATEDLAAHTSSAWGGLMSATFGNITELIIGIFALRAGLVEVVKASITGSIIGNLLFVLGISMLAGGWGREKQSFNRTGALAGGSTLFLAAIALVMPAIFVFTAPAAGAGNVVQLSLWVCLALLAMYAAALTFSLYTHKHLYVVGAIAERPRWSASRSVLVLCASTVAVAFMSELLVHSIEPIEASLGLTQLFIGVIVIAIIGNAAEHVSAIRVALKDRMDLSLAISVGSAAQIAMFVAPILVITSVLMGKPMDLVFNLFELVAIVLSVLIANLVIADGESNWFEGMQLLAAYAIIAVAFFFHQ